MTRVLRRRQQQHDVSRLESADDLLLRFSYSHFHSTTRNRTVLIFLLFFPSLWIHLMCQLCTLCNCIDASRTRRWSDDTRLPAVRAQCTFLRVAAIRHYQLPIAKWFLFRSVFILFPSHSLTLNLFHFCHFTHSVCTELFVHIGLESYSADSAANERISNIITATAALSIRIHFSSA